MTINLEAEQLNSVASGAEKRIIDDLNADGGKWVILDANNVDDYIEFTVPEITAGNYSVKYRYKAFDVRGKVQLFIGDADGSDLEPQGPTVNQSILPNNTYETVDLGIKNFSENGAYTFRFTTTEAGNGDDYKISVDNITISSTDGETPPPLEREVESLVQTSSPGSSISEIDDNQASGGSWVLLENNNVNDNIQFLVNDVIAGEYAVQYRYKSFSVRGIVQTSIGEADGTSQIDQGPSEDQSVGPNNEYRTVDLGIRNFSASGDYTFRFTAIAAGRGGDTKISVDKISLLPISVSPPTNFSVEVTSASSMRLTWVESSDSVTEYRIERRLNGGSWTFIGSVPANATSFESVGMGGNQDWEHRIQAFNETGVSNFVNSGSKTTSSPLAAPQGTLLVAKNGPFPRKGEGSIVVKNGVVRYYFGRYSGNGDSSQASIALRTSNNGGITWSEETAVFEPPTDRTYILPSIINLPDGNLGISYVDLSTEGDDGKRVFRYSDNNGDSWSSPVDLTIPEDNICDRFTGSHDRMCKSNGKLLYPVHDVCERDAGPGDFELATYVYVLDEGEMSWRISEQWQTDNPEERPDPLRVTKRTTGIDFGFWECAITTTETPNKLIMVGRTDAGFIYKSISTDNGENWSSPTTTNVLQTQAPPNIERIPGEKTLVLIFQPWYVGPLDRPVLGSMISNDDGETWENFKIIEYDGDNAFHYCSIYFDSSKDAYLTYYGQNNGDLGNIGFIDFGGSRFQKLPSSWFKS